MFPDVAVRVRNPQTRLLDRVDAVQRQRRHRQLERQHLILLLV